MELVTKKTRLRITRVSAKLDGKERTAQKVRIVYFPSCSCKRYYCMVLLNPPCFELLESSDAKYCTKDNPCQNGGTCEEKIAQLDYTCKCMTGWEGKNCTKGKNNSFSIIS